MNSELLKEIEKACDEIAEKPGFGEVVILIKNGVVYRYRLTKDKLVV